MASLSIQSLLDRGGDPDPTLADLRAHAASQRGLRRAPEPLSGRPGAAENLGKNVLAGLDPTLGVAVNLAGMEPEKPNFLVQAMTGLLSPAALPKVARTTLRTATQFIKDSAGRAGDIVPFVQRNFLDRGRASGVTIEQAISGAPTEALREFDNAIVEAYVHATNEGADEAKAALRLLASRNNAEVAARTLQGDQLASKAFEQTPDLGSMMDDFMGHHPDATPDIFSEYARHQEASGALDPFVDYEEVGEILNQSLADMPLYRLLLGMDDVTP